MKKALMGKNGGGHRIDVEEAQNYGSPCWGGIGHEKASEKGADGRSQRMEE